MSNRELRAPQLEAAKELVRQLVWVLARTAGTLVAVDLPPIAHFVEELGPGGRRDLLRVLKSPSDIRADLVRQFHDRPGGEDMAELLMILEEKEWARQAIIEEILEAEEA